MPRSIFQPDDDYAAETRQQAMREPSDNGPRCPTCGFHQCECDRWTVQADPFPIEQLP